MKNSLPVPLIVALFIACIPQLSCKKVVDYIGHHKNANLKPCNIQQLSYYYYSKTPENAVFTYNQWGDPASITIAAPRTGYPNRLFTYDKNKRLSEYKGIYSDGKSFEYFHKYNYDNHNRIVRDTVYIFGTLNPGPSDYWDADVHYFFYDSQDRIVKDSFISLNYGYNEVFELYSYNAAGNRVGVDYDTKLNLHRTNKVWMFIDRDYSVNNPFTNAVYNGYELPVDIRTSSSFLDLNFDNATVQYICDELPPALYK